MTDSFPESPPAEHEPSSGPSSGPSLAERSLGGLFTELSRETSALLRQEVRLARTELSDKVRQAGWGGVAIVAGGIFLILALQAGAGAAIFGLMTLVPGWLAALIVALVLATVGGIVLAVGLSSVRAKKLAPRRTLDMVRENTRWAKEQLR